MADAGQGAHEPVGELFADQCLEADGRCRTLASVEIESLTMLEQQLRSSWLGAGHGGGVHPEHYRPGA